MADAIANVVLGEHNPNLPAGNQAHVGQAAGEVQDMDVDQGQQQPAVPPMAEMNNLNLGQQRAAFTCTAPCGTVLTFPTYEAMRMHLDSLPNAVKPSKKLVYFGAAPPKFTGENLDTYSYAEFEDRLLTYCPLAHNDAGDTLRCMHSYVANPARRWIVNKMMLAEKTIEDYTFAEYRDLLSSFTLTLELGPVDYVCKLFAIKLGSMPFEAFMSQFNSILIKCPADVTSSEVIMIAAMRQALPGSIQEHIRYTQDGKDWTSFQAFAHAAKEQVRRSGEAGGSRAKPKPAGGNTGSVFFFG